MGAVAMGFPPGRLLPFLAAENGTPWCMEAAVPQPCTSSPAQPGTAVRAASNPQSPQAARMPQLSDMSASSQPRAAPSLGTTAGDTRKEQDLPLQAESSPPEGLTWRCHTLLPLS